MFVFVLNQRQNTIKTYHIIFVRIFIPTIQTEFIMFHNA
jgi:hypothetical protein